MKLFGYLYRRLQENSIHIEVSPKKPFSFMEREKSQQIVNPPKLNSSKKG